MVTWSIAFLLVALLAGLVGFIALAGAGTWLARFICVASLILFVWSLIAGRKRL